MVFRAAVEAKSGEFWQDRAVVSAHLPLAWTRAGPGDQQTLVSRLEELRQQFSQ